MKNMSINIPFKKFANLFVRFNLVIFIVLMSAGLITSVLILNNIISQSTNGNGNSSSPSLTKSTNFDQSTIDRLNKLELSTSNNSYQTLPSGRNNPFSE